MGPPSVFCRQKLILRPSPYPALFALSPFIFLLLFSLRERAPRNPFRLSSLNPHDDLEKPQQSRAAAAAAAND